MEEITITQEIASEICGYLRIGTTFEIAALAAGYKTEQVKEMLTQLSTAQEGVWKEFADDIKKAYAQFEVMQLMRINAEGGSRGSQWLLERSNPEKWEKAGRKPKPRQIKAEDIEILELPDWKWDF